MEKILIVDDIERQRLKYERIAKSAIGDCQTFMEDNGKDALERIKSERDISVVILDIDFSTLTEYKIIGSDPHREGFVIASLLREIIPDLQIVLTTCLDELNEPFVIRLDDTPSDIQQKIKLALRVAQLERENKELRRQLYAVKTDEVTIVGQSKSLMKVLDDAKKAAVRHDKEPILITGETGTGKDLLAKFIHKTSARSEQPFIVVDCGNINENLIESELFGHEKGSFTEAYQLKQGKFELANGGILFLDEIGNMSLKMQAKLLRAIEDGRFERVGGTKTIQSDVRVISTTNQDIQAAITAGTFRDDLYYRLSGLHFHLPPLRERKEDISLLVTHFLSEIQKEMQDKRTIKFSPELMKLFINYHWLGNVRELKRTVYRTAILSDNEILDVTDLREEDRIRLQKLCSNGNEFERIHAELSRLPEPYKTRRLLQLFAQTEGTVTREEIMDALRLKDVAANERIQVFKDLGLIQMDSRKYRKTELLDAYWNWSKEGIYDVRRNSKDIM